MKRSMKRAWALPHQTGAQYSAVEWTRGKVAVANVGEPANSLKNATCDVSFWRSVSRCRERPVPRYSEVFGVGTKGRVSSLKFTFSSGLHTLLLRWKTADNVFVVLSFNYQVRSGLEIFTYHVFAEHSFHCLPVSTSMHDGYIGGVSYAYFLETVFDKSEVCCWKEGVLRRIPVGRHSWGVVTCSVCCCLLLN